jgi:hypothetical protein
VESCACACAVQELRSLKLQATAIFESDARSDEQKSSRSVKELLRSPGQARSTRISRCGNYSGSDFPRASQKAPAVLRRRRGGEEQSAGRLTLAPIQTRANNHFLSFRFRTYTVAFAVAALGDPSCTAIMVDLDDTLQVFCLVNAWTTSRLVRREE